MISSKVVIAAAPIAPVAQLSEHQLGRMLGLQALEEFPEGTTRLNYPWRGRLFKVCGAMDRYRAESLIFEKQR